MTTPQGFAMTPRWLVEDPNVSAQAKVVFAILSGRVRQGGIRCRQQEIADILGVSWRTAHRALQELRALGVLDWTKNSGDIDGVDYVLLIDRRGLDDTPDTSVTTPLTHSAPHDTGDLPLMTPVSRLPYREKKTSSLRSERASSSDADVDEFEQWWALYPKKVGKGQARKAYKAAAKKVGPRALLDALTRQGSWLRQQHERDYCPNPATWLNGERWLDERKPEQQQQRSGVAGGWGIEVVDSSRPTCPICPEHRLHGHKSDGSIYLR